MFPRLQPALLALLFLTTGCLSPVRPAGPEEPDFRSRANRQARGALTVTTAALNADESEGAFGRRLNDFGIQPVWLEIRNDGDEPYWLFPIGIDDDYLPPREAAQRASTFPLGGREELVERLEGATVPPFVPPHSSADGFVFTDADEGAKAFTVDLIGRHHREEFYFVVPVPGLALDADDFDPGSLHDGIAVHSLDENGLREWLGRQPCCVTTPDGKAGDPLNVVFVASVEDVGIALLSRGWDLTARITPASVWRMATAFLFGARYRYAPISPLLAFGREQDMAFQKARAVVAERNHMRLWLAPVSLHGTPVWLAQISRDIGIKLTGRAWPPTTHVIDPDLDSTRFYLLQDLLYGGNVKRLAYAAGSGSATREAPGLNGEGDPWFSDGLRVVFFLDRKRTAIEDVDFLDWEVPSSVRNFREKTPEQEPSSRPSSP